MCSFWVLVLRSGYRFLVCIKIFVCVGVGFVVESEGGRCGGVGGGKGYRYIEKVRVR